MTPELHLWSNNDIIYDYSTIVWSASYIESFSHSDGHVVCHIGACNNGGTSTRVKVQNIIKSQRVQPLIVCYIVHDWI